ncbi:MAG: Competence protein ComM-like protein [Candidatus Amesbacteria bacterium GW2011_GWA2_47_11b]|uniref:Competence protein ComM-like protein n=1 Tax=Candidatus Amesbacteria bacterium GW2011_GWA2_47_11b TaxID=1618358 RepID=A0A0G1UIA2_9BACT|nr:MAG: Competence protein ComM-like protein [Candidatus Amesbacteria bacterium GW2011_GWA2_47_11b]
MLARIRSVAHVGLVSVAIEVEVDVAEQGFPGFNIVGLAGKAVEEARERVKTAINNSGLDFPPKKITVNLAPADLPKDGGAYDLPIAVGILTASGQVPAAGGIYYGELSLDGTLRATKGVLLVGLFSKKGEIYVPVESANEAAVVEEVTVYPVRNLQELVDHLNGVKAIQPLNHLAILSLVEDAVVRQERGKLCWPGPCRGYCRH